jgi:hypothetical protein
MDKFARVQAKEIGRTNALSAITDSNGPEGQCLTCTICAVHYRYFRERIGGRAYGASSLGLSASSRPMLDAGEAASSSPDSAASASPDPSELVASSLVELLGLAAAEVPGRD